MKKSSTILMIISLMALGIGIYMLATPHKDYVETKAVIDRIESEWIDEDNTEYHVFVTYTYEGTTYEEAELGDYKASYGEGKEITIMVDPKDPTNIEGTGRQGAAIYATIIGGVMLLVSIFMKLRGK